MQYFYNLWQGTKFKKIKPKLGVKDIAIGVVDFGLRRSNQKFIDILNHTKKLVQLTDKKGFTSYWFGEHYNDSLLTFTSPLILISYFASKTNHIRLGTGALLIVYQNIENLKHQLENLSALSNQPIEIGIGFAPGTENSTIQNSLGWTSSKESKITKYNELADWVNSKKNNINLIRLTSTLPEYPSLSETTYYAHFIKPNNYSVPSNKVIKVDGVTVFASLASTHRELEILNKTHQRLIDHMVDNKHAKTLCEKEIMEESKLEDEVIQYRSIVGLEDQFYAKTTSLLSFYGTRKLMIIPIHYDPNLELEMIEKIGNLFNLRNQ